jgi:hypothetical protein
MAEAGFTYYTGKQAYLEANRGGPPDVVEYTGPEMDRERFDYLGLEEDDTVHYLRELDDSLELEEWSWQMDGSLNQRKERHSWTHFPAAKLHRHIRRRDWKDLDEPDYQQLREQYSAPRRTSTTNSDGGEQTELEHWK